MKKKTPKHTDKLIDVSGRSIPLRIYTELRSSVRVSLGKDFVILRIPLFFAGSKEKHIEFARTWLENLALRKPAALFKYDTKKYENDFLLTILGMHEFMVKVQEVDRKNGMVEMMGGNQILVSIPQEDNEVHKKKMIRTLLSRIVAKKFKKLIEERVHFWNAAYFKKPIKKIYLKYNSSNWGSCSIDSNINLSTRSLLLPMEIFDYIIVHELSHLVEMNHSDRFWKVVHAVMPDYENREQWLKLHGSKLDF